MHRFILADSLAWELFNDQALLFIPKTETFITVNKSMIEIIQLVEKHLSRPFSTNEMKNLILGHYHLSVIESGRQTRALLRSWLDCGIIQKI